MPNLAIGGTYEFHGHLLSDPSQPYSLKVKVVGQPRTQVLTPGLEAYLLDLLFDTPIDVEQPTRWPWRANESEHGEFFMVTTQVKQHIESVTGYKVNIRKLGMSMRTRFKRAVNRSRWGYFIRKKPVPTDLTLPDYLFSPVQEPQPKELIQGIEAYLLSLLFNKPECVTAQEFMTTTQVKNYIESVTGHQVGKKNLGILLKRHFKRVCNGKDWGYLVSKLPIPNDHARLAASVGCPRWVLPSTVVGHDEFKLKPQPTPQPQPTHQADWFDELTQPQPVRRPGRPRKYPNQFLLNLTESERLALEALATKFNCSMTQAVRQALAAYATTTTTATKPEFTVMQSPAPDLFNQVNTSGL